LVGYVEEQGLTFAVAADPDATIAGQWGVAAVPTSFVLDPEGRIRFSVVGYTTEVGLRVRLWAAEHL
jgi:peroxiredoxin